MASGDTRLLLFGGGGDDTKILLQAGLAHWRSLLTLNLGFFVQHSESLLLQSAWKPTKLSLIHVPLTAALGSLQGGSVLHFPDEETQ